MRTRIASVVVVLLIVASLTAQGVRSGIAGIVTDASGALLSGVTVTVDGPVSRSSVTDSQGAYAFNLPPGLYDVRFALPGFQTLARRITVIDGRIERVNVELNVGALEETITVTREARRGVPAGSVGGVVGGLPDAPPPTAAAAGPPPPIPPPLLRRSGRPFNTEAYDRIDENPFRRV